MLAGVLAFLLVVVALTAIPVELRFRVAWRGLLRNDTELIWAFGLVRIRLPSHDDTPQLPRTEAPAHSAHRSARATRNGTRLSVIMRERPFRRRLLRFVRDLWGALRKNNVRIRSRIGLGSPADTGQLWSMLGPVSAMLRNIESASIRVEPEFLKSTLEVDSCGSVRLVPLQLVYLTTALLLSPVVWRGYRAMRTARP